MTVTRRFVITIASGLIGALAGTGIGYALGQYAPDYYRTVFRIPPTVDLDPIQTGIGLGLTQGLGAGLVIGLVVVLAVTWHSFRTAASNAEQGAPADPDVRRDRRA